MSGTELGAKIYLPPTSPRRPFFAIAAIALKMAVATLNFY